MRGKNVDNWTVENMVNWHSHWVIGQLIAKDNFLPDLNWIENIIIVSSERTWSSVHLKISLIAILVLLFSLICKIGSSILKSNSFDLLNVLI